MARSVNNPEPPQLARKVARREAVEATAKFPDDLRIELARIWVGDGDRAEPTVRRLGDTGAYVVEALPQAGVTPPPNVEFEALKAARVRGLSGDQDNQGYRAAHLPLVYQPRLVEKPRRLKVREGNDLPNSVFAPDTRYIYQDTSFPWCTVGRVETAGGICTGTMIGRRLLLTGSHCITWTSDGTGWIKFTPAYYNGLAPFGIAWAQRVISWAKADGSDGLSDQETAFDYVVVVLDRNMGDLTGYAGYRTYSSSWNNGGYWQQMGYPNDLSGTQRPAFSGGGAITSVDSKSTSGQTGYVMGHFIDTFGGHSGGPYWGWWGDEPWPRVVGTDSTSPATPGNDTSGDNEAGGGPALSSLIAYARNKYP